jgi:hypothetical protein
MIDRLVRFAQETIDSGPMSSPVGATHLAYELTPRDPAASSLADIGSLALRNGIFTKEPSLPVSPEHLAEQRVVNSPGSTTELHFGTWTDTTQEPPVTTPAQLRITSKPPRGVIARLLKKSIAVVSPLEAYEPPTTD